MLVMGNYSAIVPCGHLSFKPCNARLFSISIALGARIRVSILDKADILEKVQEGLEVRYSVPSILSRTVSVVFGQV